MYRGSLQLFYWDKGIHEILDVICAHFNVERIKLRSYLSNLIKFDTSSDYMKVKIDHWLDFFEKFYQQYIIMPTELYNYYATEESRYIAVRTPPGFINQ